MTNERKPIEFAGVFASHIREYVEWKHSLGYKFTIEAYMLRQFDTYCVNTKVETVALTSELMDNWLATKPNDKPSTRGSRLSTLKGFRDYLLGQGICVLWNPLPGHTGGRKTNKYVPYIFTHEEILRIFKAADNLSHTRWTAFDSMFPVILRILYGCGLRVSEAVSLRINNLDFGEKSLTVLASKFEKNRRIPMSQSLQKILERYLKSGICSIDTDGFLFPNQTDFHYSKRTVYDTFRKVLHTSGIPYQGKGKGPRLHDLRHTFAVHSLQNHIAAGYDSYTILPILASYLGHTDVSTTERYLRLTAEFYPDLLAKSDVIVKNIIPGVNTYEE